MGRCRYCGEPAGFLRSQHRGCVDKHIEGGRAIARLVEEAPFSTALDSENLERIRAIAHRSFVDEAQRRQLCAQGWASAVNHSLQNGVISEEQEHRLVEVADHLAIPRAYLERNGSWERVVKSAVIRDLLHGILPNRINLDRGLNLNLQKNEQVIWAFQHVEYLEDRVYRQYVGGSRGVSVRVAKGVYYRVGAFKGQAVNRTERVHVDTGLMAVTNRNIYFSGPMRSFRVPYSKIVSFQPFEDGVGIVRDAVSAKPQIFITSDGWFVYNLVTNLAHF